MKLEVQGPVSHREQGVSWDRHIRFAPNTNRAQKYEARGETEYLVNGQSSHELYLSESVSINIGPLFLTMLNMNNTEMWGECHQEKINSLFLHIHVFIRLTSVFLISL